jgi:aspartyl-tRNA(Asn)/glutamyl-tRNA(Gln) amidotransferase subunit A
MKESTYLGAAETATRIRSGRLSPVDAVEVCLRRIETLDDKLRAWATVSKRAALDTARALERELEERGPRGPLHGIPVGVKDVYYTAGVKTSAGSKLCEDFVPEYSATAVRRLESAGAIVLGKTACTEFAANDPAPTRNPWNLDHTPGGSSSGSAAAVAARTCFVTLDTQTAGDILRPAAYNGVVGLKPSYGRISRRGTIPVAWSLDTGGVMARSVEDAALALGVLAGHDPEDQSSSSGPVRDYVSTSRGWSDPPTLGLLRRYFYDHASEKVREHTERVVDLLGSAGARIEEVEPPEDLGLVYAAHRTVVFSECAAYHQETFRQRPEDYGPKLRQLIELGQATPAVSYIQAQRLRRRFARRLGETLHGVDAFITATTPTTAPSDLSETGDRRFQIPWTFAGVPAINMPSGLDRSGLPFGIQLIGALFAEDRLLATAYWCEKALSVDLSPPPRGATKDLEAVREGR